jgi:UDP-N-acetylmuramate: L-alanyl-gamma-D-glutamyl-meso-diaminopimelate ligase
MQNGLCAIYAAHHIGVEIKTACEALNTFQGVKRRLEIKHQTANITLYDDFAHHPSAALFLLLLGVFVLSF